MRVGRFNPPLQFSAVMFVFLGAGLSYAACLFEGVHRGKNWGEMGATLAQKCFNPSAVTAYIHTEAVLQYR